MPKDFFDCCLPLELLNLGADLGVWGSHMWTEIAVLELQDKYISKANRHVWKTAARFQMYYR